MNNSQINPAPTGEIKLFHIADLHLGSPFSGLDVRSSDARREELLRSFEDAVTLAAREGCHAILIAGDLFDCGYAGIDTIQRVFSALGACGLPTVIAPGNHDPYTDGGIYESKGIPDNVYVFESPKMSCFDLDGVGLRVHGYAFNGRSYTDDPLAGEVTPAEGRYNVLCAHGDIYSPLSTYAPINLPRLGELGFDYVALGHIHKYSEPIRIKNSLVAYSGFPEGRSFDECGFGGALIVTLSRDSEVNATVQRVVLSKKRYLTGEVDVTGASNVSDLVSTIKGYLAKNGLGRETSLRLTLTGTVDPSLQCDRVMSADEAGLALLEIRNDTLPMFDAEYLENDITLRGALYRQLLPMLNSPDGETRRVAIGALRMGLAALEGRALTRQ